jgi:hypothetical protein
MTPIAFRALADTFYLGNPWQDSKDDRADGGRAALGSQRQDGM